jgi:uncharacterized RDD family membrane protein YckC
MKIADLPDRGLAVLIDGFILGFVIEAANKVLRIPSLNLGEMELSSSAQLAIILPVIYYGLMEGSPSGATVGKQAMSLRVTNLDGGRLSYPQAFLRAVVRLIPFSWILALGSNGRAVHDYVAGSKVVEL